MIKMDKGSYARNLKNCTKCKKVKDADLDFYLCLGKVRSECKSCTIKRNVKYQKKVRAWKTKYEDHEERRTYMRGYYAKNKQKYSQYRKEFRERYPNYYRDYYKSRKGKNGEL